MSVVVARGEVMEETRSCSFGCSSDKSRLDYVADSEASSDEEDGGGSVRRRSLTGVNVESRQSIVLSPDHGMMHEECDTDPKFSISNGDSKKHKKNTVVAKPVGEVIQMDMKSNTLRHPLHTFTKVGKFVHDHKPDLHKRLQGYCSSEPISRLNHRRVDEEINMLPPAGKDQCTNATHSISGEAILSHSPITNGAAAGLAYIGSQEPGASGVQCLAKRADHGWSVRRAGIFDWNNSLEDERQDGFLSNRIDWESSSIPLKSIYLNSRIIGGALDMSGKKESGNFRTRSNLTSLTCPDPCLVPENPARNKKLHVSETKTKNLFKDMDEWSNSTSLEQQLEADVVGSIKDVYDVGPNTQMAAEAMEVLFHGAPVSHELEEHAHPVGGKLTADSCRGMMVEKASAMNISLQKIVSSSLKSEGIQMQCKGRKACRTISRENVSSRKCSTKSKTKRRKLEDTTKKTEVDMENWDLQEHSYAIASANANGSSELSKQEKGLESVDAIASAKSRSGQIPSNPTKWSPMSGLKTRASVNFAACKHDLGKDSAKCLTNNCSTAAMKHRVPLKEVKVSKLSTESVSNFKGVEGRSLSVQQFDVACKAPLKEINTGVSFCVAGDPLRRPFKEGLSKSSSARELIRLKATEAASTWISKGSRKRKDMTSVRVLFSQNLDVDIIKHQRKILAHFRISVASSISDATHFVTDKFAQTRNMLEAMAMGKPVVTNTWLESCGQASCYIDEKNYILRDLKKEREIGFSMPTSLNRAQHCPLLQGRSVLITPKVKPDRELVAGLVKAAHGQPLEQIGTTEMRENKAPDGLIIISCKEDYEICIPLLERGGNVFSPELLLNGIVIQKLEFERHRLFSGSC